MTTKEIPSTKKNATVIIGPEIEPGCSEAIEQLLVGFANGNLNQVQDAIRMMVQGRDSDRLTGKISAMVEDFHRSVRSVSHGFDPASITMHTTNIPDAARKLEYVLHATNEASHKLFLLVEKQEGVLNRGDHALQQLELAVDKQGLPRELLTSFSAEYKEVTTQAREVLSDIIMTQEFQDLCGQALKKVLKLVQEMEGNLGTLLKCLGVELSAAVAEESVPAATVKVDQDSADDLLKQFGF
jgi:chemotaxis protein CheZ